MLSRFTQRSLSLITMAALSSFACTHDPKSEDASDRSMTDDVRSTPMPVAERELSRPTPQAPIPPTPKKPHHPKLRTEAAAAREAVRDVAPGSDAAYAQEVDAAVGAESATSGNLKDNSRVNRVSNGEIGLTAEQQGRSPSDIELTRKIRKAVTDDKALSIYAHNVKIITRDGKVFLKGPVRSEGERDLVETYAARIAGAKQVTSGLDVEPK